MKIYPYLLIFKFLIMINVISEFSYGKEQKINFWNQPRAGANVFNQVIDKELIVKAKEYNIGFLRIAPDKFISKTRDFLVGNADNYQNLNNDDLKYLIKVLDYCTEIKMPVVITMLSLPGSRWNQNNNNIDDLRIWQSNEFQVQAAAFWQDLAKTLKNYDIIVGYDILNEPHLERLYDSTSMDIDQVKQDKVQPMLLSFYQEIIGAVRKVDKSTPIIVESSSYGSPLCFKDLRILQDPYILYSFHMYEPYSYTTAKINKGNFSYPGKIKNIYWDKQRIIQYLRPIIDFQNKYNIASNRILAGEFGGNRTTPNIELYFQDLIDVFNENKWHSAVYAFREDTWEGMNYELGKQKLSYSYWQAIERGEKPILSYDHDNPIVKVLKSYWLKN